MEEIQVSTQCPHFICFCLAIICATVVEDGCRRDRAAVALMRQGQSLGQSPCKLSVSSHHTARFTRANELGSPTPARNTRKPSFY